MCFRSQAFLGRVATGRGHPMRTLPPDDFAPRSSLGIGRRTALGLRRWPQHRRPADEPVVSVAASRARGSSDGCCGRQAAQPRWPPPSGWRRNGGRFCRRARVAAWWCERPSRTLSSTARPSLVWPLHLNANDLTAVFSATVQPRRSATSAASESTRFIVSAEGFGSVDFPERQPTKKIFPPTEKFEGRHIGPSPADVKAMLSAVGCETMEDLISQTVPADIRLGRPLDLPAGRPEAEMLVRRCRRPLADSVLSAHRHSVTRTTKPAPGRLARRRSSRPSRRRIR
jgi:hypothetical protein